MKKIIGIIFVVCILGCGGEESDRFLADSGPDTFSDTDIDVDSDGDIDADSDLDVDIDSDIDTDTDSDTEIDSDNCIYECWEMAIDCVEAGGIWHQEMTCPDGEYCCDVGSGDTDIDTDSDSDSDLDIDSDTDSDSDSDTDTDSDSDIDSDSDTDTDTNTDTGTDTTTDTDTNTDTGTDTETDTNTDTDDVCPYTCVSMNGWYCESFGWITHEEYECFNHPVERCCDMSSGDTDTDTDTETETDTDTDTTTDTETDTDTDTGLPVCPYENADGWRMECVHYDVGMTCEDSGYVSHPEYSCQEGSQYHCCEWNIYKPICPEVNTEDYKIGCTNILAGGKKCEDFDKLTRDDYICRGEDEDNIWCCEWSVDMEPVRCSATWNMWCISNSPGWECENNGGVLKPELNDTCDYGVCCYFEDGYPW